MAPYLATDHPRKASTSATRSHAQRHPDLRGRRPDPGRGRRPVLAQAAGRWSPFLERALRPLPVRDRRRHRRRRARARLRAGDPDEARLRLRRRPRGRWLHELAHQWFGDAVTLTEWPDIWLHEGFATWSEWIWAEHTAADDGRRRLRRSCCGHARRATPTSGTRRRANPGGPAQPVRRHGLRPRRDDARGAAGAGSATATFYRAAPLVRRAPLRQRLDAGVHRARGAGQRPALGAFFELWLYTPGKPAGLPETAASRRSRAEVDHRPPIAWRDRLPARNHSCARSSSSPAAAARTRRRQKPKPPVKLQRLQPRRHRARPRQHRAGQRQRQPEHRAGAGPGAARAGERRPLQLRGRAGARPERHRRRRHGAQPLGGARPPSASRASSGWRSRTWSAPARRRRAQDRAPRPHASRPSAAAASSTRSCPKGLGVCEQEPAAGSRVRRGSTVRVVVARAC